MPQGGEQIETEEATYIRYSADVWYIWLGESLETLFFSEVIEKEYQRFILQKA